MAEIDAIPHMPPGLTDEGSIAIRFSGLLTYASLCPVAALGAMLFRHGMRSTSDLIAWTAVLACLATIVGVAILLRSQEFDGRRHWPVLSSLVATAVLAEVSLGLTHPTRAVSPTPWLVLLAALPPVTTWATRGLRPQELAARLVVAGAVAAGTLTVMLLVIV